MIPKTIHYCWFGDGDLPRSAQRCIESWRRFFPGYEIKRWDETNFDINSFGYSRDAYRAGKYAFVSDVARFVILYNAGGIYFDTDVEVIGSFDDIIERGAFMGFETRPDSGNVVVASGLGMGAEPGMPLYKDIIDSYSVKKFSKQVNKSCPDTVATHVSKILIEHGLSNDDSEIQKVEGINIYPSEYFCPLSTVTGKLEITPQTCSIHWYAQSWQSPIRKYGRKLLLRVGGQSLKTKMKSLLFD